MKRKTCSAVAARENVAVLHDAQRGRSADPVPRPVPCALCHYTSVRDVTGWGTLPSPGLPSLSTAVHRAHAALTDDGIELLGQTLHFVENLRFLGRSLKLLLCLRRVWLVEHQSNVARHRRGKQKCILLRITHRRTNLAKR